MIPILAICVGIVCFIGGTHWLWYMLARPKEWERLNNAENSFWIRRGLPVKWVGACRQFEQGWGLKVLVAFSVIVAAVLTVTPFVLLFLSSRHR